MSQTVLRNAVVYDGTGAEPRQEDVAISGDRIHRVGTVGRAEVEIDASGLAVAPGFIDVHTHDDFAAVVHPDMTFKLRDGVTTCLAGNCGMGCAPFAEASTFARIFHPHAALPEWTGYAGYLAHLDAHPPGTNIGVLVGHGTLRLAAMGSTAGPPSAAQMRRMKADLTEGLEAGAFGLSTGLVYEPGCYAEEDEIVELASILRGTGGVYASHMRDEGTGLLASVGETIGVGERAGVPVQISHHKAFGRAAWGLVEQSLRLIEEAQARGVDVHADQYPYTAGSTVLSAVLGRTLGSGEPLRLADIVIASTAAHADWEGESIPSLAARLREEPTACIARILAEEPDATVIVHSMDERDVSRVLRHPSTMIGSDGIPTLEGRPHPRLFGSFSRVLGRYARDQGLFSLAEAVHRMTGLPAGKFGLAGRGVIREGAIADLVVFDPARIIDTGTFEEPHSHPRGIEHVFVGGALAVRAGTPTGVRAGRALRRIS